MEDFLQQLAAVAQSDWVATLLTAAAIIVVTLLVERIVRRFMRGLLSIGEVRNLPAGSIFVNIARAAVYVLGACVLLSTCFGVDVSAAITALGIGGIAVSLGCQDTISNLIGGLQLSVMRLIAPGEFIEVSGTKGEIQDVTWRHTTVLTSAGEEVVIPNSVLNKASFKRLAPTATVKVPLVVPADVDDLDETTRAIERVAGEAAAQVAVVVKEPSLTFSAVEPTGFRGTLTMVVENDSMAAPAADAALRAIAPLVRSSAPAPGSAACASADAPR